MAPRDPIRTTIRPFRLAGLMIGSSLIFAASGWLVSCTGDEFEGCQASRTCPGSGGAAGVSGGSGGSGSSGGSGGTSASSGEDGGAAGANGTDGEDETATGGAAGTRGSEGDTTIGGTAGSAGAGSGGSHGTGGVTSSGGNGGTGTGGSAGTGGATSSGGSAGTGGGSTATTGVVAECLNGEVEGEEECDDGEATPTCSADCISCVAPTPMTVVDQELGFCTSACLEGWVGNGQTVAQQFRVAQAGVLSSVEVYVINYASQNNEIVLKLVDAGTTANLLSGASASEIESHVVGTATLPGSIDAFAWERFDFSAQNINLDPSSYYFLWLDMLPTSSAGTSVNIRWNLWNDSTVADPYPEGRAYFCPPESPCQLEPQLRLDYAFRVRITPPLPLCE